MMKLFGGYIRYRAGVIAAYIAVMGIFSSSYLLFDIPPIAVFYPLILCTVAGAFLIIFDFFSYARRHRMIINEDFPKAANQLEEDYLELVAGLKEEIKKTAVRSSENYNNMIEYYTVWAHQIKTPIAAMRLNLQTEDSESARRLMGDLNRIESYVDMVLTFLRLDSDSTDYLIKEYDLDEIIRPAVKKFSREFILKKLRLDYRPVRYSTVTDSKWMSFIIEQIISNAVKYTSKGEVRIYMDKPGLLVIEDTGIGISPEDLPRIFENGYTGFNGREDKRASGIGLYLCRRIADNLGHRIYAESEIGKGTAMTIDLRSRDISVE